MGGFPLHIMGAAAEFERELIKERVTAGINAVKKVGKRLGRPKSVFRRAEVRRLRDESLSIREICAWMDLSIGTVTRALQQAG